MVPEYYYSYELFLYNYIYRPHFTNRPSQCILYCATVSFTYLFYFFVNSFYFRVSLNYTF